MLYLYGSILFNVFANMIAIISYSVHITIKHRGYWIYSEIVRKVMRVAKFGLMQVKCIWREWASLSGSEKSFRIVCLDHCILLKNEDGMRNSHWGSRISEWGAFQIFYFILHSRLTGCLRASFFFKLNTLLR